MNKEQLDNLKDAKLTLKLKAKSGYSSTQEEMISLNQWNDINKIIRGENIIESKDILEMNIDNLISKFTNGKERFLNDAVFNSTINCLARNYDKITLTGELLDVIDNQSKLINKQNPLL